MYLEKEIIISIFIITLSAQSVGLTVHIGWHSVWVDLTVSVPRFGYLAQQVVHCAKLWQLGTMTPHMLDNLPVGTLQ